jgi:hypothetical protein
MQARGPRAAVLLSDGPMSAHGPLGREPPGATGTARERPPVFRAVSVWRLLGLGPESGPRQVLCFWLGRARLRATGRERRPDPHPGVARSPHAPISTANKPAALLHCNQNGASLLSGNLGGQCLSTLIVWVLVAAAALTAGWAGLLVWGLRAAAAWALS